MGIRLLQPVLFLLFAVSVIYLYVSPSDASAEDQYGAIAFSTTTLAHGYSYDYANQAAAERKAVSECEKQSGSDDCKVVIWFKNACGMLAVGDKGYGAGWGTSMETAVLQTFDNCLKWTDNCRVVRWVCTSNAAPIEPSGSVDY